MPYVQHGGRMHNKKNLITAIIYQLISMVSGLILPRLIISTFGSNVNGLVTSISQFLGFISLLEGGLGAVVLAELYKPIENRDKEKIIEILNECQRFFLKLSVIFVLYTCALAIIYPIFINRDFSFEFTSTLVIILSITTVIKYLFSITYRLYLQANQKIYIVNIVSAIISIGNLLLAYLVIKTYPEIHMLKLLADFMFLLQPITFKRFIEEKFWIKISVFDIFKKNNSTVLKNRWSGFAQNLAHYINMNTDVVVLTVFSSLADVSVYSVYLLAITALRTFLSLVSNSYQSAFGKYIAEGNQNNLEIHFRKFNFYNSIITIAFFSTCMVLITPFVMLYTEGVRDVNYYQPLFGIIMTMANLVFCVREPYRYLVLAAGKFKETNNGAIIEAVLNVIISIIFVSKYGLIGVAIGTLVAISYRYIYFLVFLHKNIIYIQTRTIIGQIALIILVAGINVVIMKNISFSITSYYSFFLYGILIGLTELLTTASLSFVIQKIIKIKVI